MDFLQLKASLLSEFTVERFKSVMLDGDRYKLLFDGLRNTFIITIGALAIGILIGIIVAAFRL